MDLLGGFVRKSAFGEVDVDSKKMALKNSSSRWSSLLFPLDIALVGLAVVLSESDMLNVLLLIEKCLQYELQIASER